MVLILSMNNHCPYVLHIIEEFSRIAAEYQKKGLGIAGINTNDIEVYPQEAPSKMIEFSQIHNMTFPYLLDDRQHTAREYRAACTPDFFLFDGDRKLVYRGQFDDSRPDNGKDITGDSLRAALDAVLSN